jgi:hypothetical protein
MAVSLQPHECSWMYCCCVCRYARSIVSCVGNARKLQRSLVPEEQRSWQCVWEEAAGASWDTYGATALAGMTALGLVAGWFG